MNPAFQTVILKAAPRTEVRIVERDHGDEPPPSMLRAAFNAGGEVEILLPVSPRPWVILAPGYRTESLTLSGDGEPVSLTLTPQ